MIEKIPYTGKDHQNKAYVDNERKCEPKVIPIELTEAETFTLELRTDDHLVLSSETFIK